MTKEELDAVAKEMSWEDQNWLFNRLMDRLWPNLAGKKVALVEATGFYAEDDGWTDEDSEWYRRKAEEAEREREEGFPAGGRGDS
jgi:hypothetical protein